jgi:hypothetical protein
MFSVGLGSCMSGSRLFSPWLFFLWNTPMPILTNSVTSHISHPAPKYAVSLLTLSNIQNCDAGDE